MKIYILLILTLMAVIAHAFADVSDIDLEIDPSDIPANIENMITTIDDLDSFKTWPSRPSRDMLNVAGHEHLHQSIGFPNVIRLCRKAGLYAENSIQCQNPIKASKDSAR